MSYSSILDQHPEYASLLGSGALVESPFEDFEVFRVEVLSPSPTRALSGWVSKRDLPDFRVRRVDGKPPRFYLSINLRIKGQIFKAMVRLGVRVVGNNNFTFFAPSNALYQTAVAKLRRLVAPLVSNRRSAPARSSSSAPRPSPETILIPYKTVVDVNGSVTLTLNTRPFYRRTWTGVRTPGFKSLKKRQYPVNPHTVFVEHLDVDSLAQTSRHDTNGEYSVYFDAMSTVYAPPPELGHNSQAENKAISNLIKRMNVQIDANLAQDFAQVGQLTRLIAGSASKIVGSVRALKRGNITLAANRLFAGRNPRFRGKGPSITNSLAQNWLELQYGWKPLLQDIHGSFEALSVFNEDENFVRVVTAVGTARSEGTGTFYLRNLSAYGSHGRYYVQGITKCKLTVRYKISDPLKSFLAQTGFTNPVNLAWEILPFSFVADWFLPIGPFLETLSSWDGLTFLEGSRTRFTRELAKSVVDYAGDSPFNPALTIIDHGDYSRETVRLDRVRLATFPAQTFPSLKNGLASIDHALNAVALLRGVFK